MRFDLVVIGNDEAAIELSLAAAGSRRTLTVLPESRHSSWMAGQALRRLVLTLLADRTDARRMLFARRGTPGLLLRLLRNCLVRETSDLERLLRHAGAEVLIGEARFQSAQQIGITTGADCSRRQVESSVTVVATGVRPAAMQRSLGLLPSDSMESLFEGALLPREIQFLGGDDVALGLAALFSLFGVQTAVHLDTEIDSALAELAGSAGVRIRTRIGEHREVDGKRYSCRDRRIVDCRRLLGFTEHLNLSAVGVVPDERGQLWCSDTFETWCSSVYGIGDVVGFGGQPLLTASQQADRVLHRLHHRIRRPNYLKTRLRLAPESVGDFADERFVVAGL